MTNCLRWLVNRASMTAVGGATNQDKATITIAALDKTLVVDFEPDAGVTECCGDFA